MSHILARSSPPDNSVPSAFRLVQNFPNPFNPSTTIRCALSQGVPVTLSVFNTLGQRVATLVGQKAGMYDVVFDGKGLANGLYFYQLTAGEFIQPKKSLL